MGNLLDLSERHLELIGASSEMADKIRHLIHIDDEIIRELEELCHVMDDIQNKLNDAKKAAAGVSISGSALMIGGILLAPFTMGGSLAMTGVGAAANLSGAITSVVTNAINSDRNRELLEKIGGLEGRHEETLRAANDAIQRVKRAMIDVANDNIPAENLPEVVQLALRYVEKTDGHFLQMWNMVRAGSGGVELEGAGTGEAVTPLTTLLTGVNRTLGAIGSVCTIVVSSINLANIEEYHPYKERVQRAIEEYRAEKHRLQETY